MAYTRNDRIRSLTKHICLINPGHEKIFVIGIGIIKEEWYWCNSLINDIKSADSDDEFRHKAALLIKYIRFKFVQNRAPKRYKYPDYSYIFHSSKPRSQEFIRYDVEGISVFFTLKTRD